MKWISRCLMLTSALVASAVVHAAEPAVKPNIVFILCDDLGYGDVACNNPEGKTPTPDDRLAAILVGVMWRAPTAASEGAQRPNIVGIMADDPAYATIRQEMAGLLKEGWSAV